ncbi:ATP-grasp domain-containing protein [Photorhabdus luminescens]|uniref:ATP-grasp domain-containing protein n=1 Tax=Photorhabdus luminescens TaxID=29488 RepID=UPI00223FFD77|nr:ATP-grasp domain-containing protein [Photorhabdus luminescens]MCW7762561.1 ATP-grasp domain-containing protein [Photorhabdus luminescens subsp. venezuelensis]
MSILILNRSAMSYSAYHNWFENYFNNDLYYFTAPGRRDLIPALQEQADKHYVEIREYKDYDNSDALERDVLELHKKVGIRAIVAMSEWDQIRAGRLRELMGIRGTNEATALAYRDKLLMKNILHKAGIKVTSYQAVSNILELIGFIKVVGYPVVIKPRLLAAAVGLTVLRNEKELYAFARTGFGKTMESQKLIIAEKLVNFRYEYHVDGILQDGSLKLIWPSRYLGSVSSFGDESMFGAVTLAPEDPVRFKLQDLVRNCLSVLPELTDSTFHAEIFETTDGQLVVNEIAARTGGYRINDQIKASFGVWLNREWARMMAGFSEKLVNNFLLSQLSGYVMLRPKPGRLIFIPELCPLIGTYDYRVAALVGDKFESGKSSADHIASAVVTGDNYEQVVERLEKLHQWFYENLELA